jgi:hypothetical protein
LAICTLVSVKTQDAGKPYLDWPVFRRSVVAAFPRSLTHSELNVHFERGLAAPAQFSKQFGQPVKGEGRRGDNGENEDEDEDCPSHTRLLENSQGTCLWEG